MRELLLAVVLASAGLAGCIGADDAALEETNATDATPAEANETDLGLLPDGSEVPVETRLSACHEQIGVFPVPEDQVGEVPDGFETVGFDPLGQTATLVVLALSCSVDGVAHREVWGMVEVRPPEELASEEADVSMLVLGAITTSEHQTATYRAWGLGDGVLDGDATVETLHEAPMGRAGHVLATDGDFTIHVYTGVGGEPVPEEPGNARVFGAADGRVTGSMDVAWTASQQGYDTGEATLAVEGESPLPLPQPQGEGIGVHAWGEDYDVTYEYVDLER